MKNTAYIAVYFVALTFPVIGSLGITPKGQLEQQLALPEAGHAGQVEIVPPVHAADENHAPKLVLIPEIKLEAHLVAGGEDDNGLQFVPPDAATVSWWRYGTVPGRYGSAVLAGHFRLDDGKPGVFFRLRELSKGDEIVIINSDQTSTIFTVTDTAIYKKEEFPLKKVYSQKGKKRLNLVTCTGSYIASQNDYTHRQVVYAEQL